MRLIDADALMEKIGITKECKDCARNGMRGCLESSAFVWACESITEAPDIEAVPVVRCKDCAKAQHDTIFGGWYCKGKRKEPTDYCSCGEREAEGVPNH